VILMADCLWLVEQQRYCARRYTNTHTHTRRHAYTYTHKHTHARTHTHTHAHTRTHIHTFTQIKYSYTHTHTPTHHLAETCLRHALLASSVGIRCVIRSTAQTCKASKIHTTTTSWRAYSSSLQLSGPRLIYFPAP
jgi:hypothetical protein